MLFPHYTARTEGFRKSSKALSDFLFSLSLPKLKSDALKGLIFAHVIEVESGAFSYGFNEGKEWRVDTTIKKCNYIPFAPERCNSASLSNHDRVDLIVCLLERAQDEVGEAQRFATPEIADRLEAAIALLHFAALASLESQAPVALSDNQALEF